MMPWKYSLLLAVALMLGACASQSMLYPPGPDEPRVPFYLVSNGWHTGVVVRRADIPSGLWPEREDFPDAEYLEVGWGDEDFYIQADPGVWTTFKAAFVSAGSVLHVVGFQGSVPAYFSAHEIMEFRPSRRGFVSMIQFIHDSFDRQGDERVAPIEQGRYGFSRFYPARGRFSFLNTCNNWSADALRAAGYPISSSGAYTGDIVLLRGSEFGAWVQSPSLGAR